jgi:hypothetical protein
LEPADNFITVDKILARWQFGTFENRKRTETQIQKMELGFVDSWLLVDFELPTEKNKETCDDYGRSPTACNNVHIAWRGFVSS